MTAVAHKIKPSLAAVKLVLENTISPRQNKQNIIANPFLRTEQTIVIFKSHPNSFLFYLVYFILVILYFINNLLKIELFLL